MSKNYVTLANINLKKDYSEKLTEENKALLEEALGNLVITVDSYFVKSLEVNGNAPVANDNGKVYLNARSMYDKYGFLVEKGHISEQEAEQRYSKDAEFGRIGEIQIVTQG